MERLPRDRPMKIILRTSFICDKKRGRPRRRCGSCGENIYKTLGVRNWLDAAKDR